MLATPIRRFSSCGDEASSATDNSAGFPVPLRLFPVLCPVTAITSFPTPLWHPESVLPTSGKDSGAASSHWGVERWRPLRVPGKEPCPHASVALAGRADGLRIDLVPGGGGDPPYAIDKK